MEKEEEEEKEEEQVLKKRKLTEESAPFYDWPSSSEELENEEFIDECLISARNLDLTVSVADIQNFFATNPNIGETPEVVLKPREDENGVVVAMGAVIRFNSLEEAQAAVGMKRNDLLGRPVMLTHYPNGVRTVCVTGFDPQKSEDDLWDQLAEKFASVGAIKRCFFPRSTTTNSYLGFAYVYIRELEDDEKESDEKESDEKESDEEESDEEESDEEESDEDDEGETNEDDEEETNEDDEEEEDDEDFETALERLDKTMMGGFPIRVYHVNLKTWVNELITRGAFITLTESIEALQKAFEEHRQIDIVLETDQEVTFSWRNTRPELFFDYMQKDSECWAIVLSRGHFALHKLADPDHSSSSLPVEKIVDGVPSGCQLSGDGLDKMKDAAPFLLKHVKDVKFHHRPKTDNNEDYEDFLTKLIGLAKKVPVAVMINCIPEYLRWDGKGIFSPTVLDLCRMAMEKDPGHGLLLSGVGIENGKKFIEFQDSFGEDRGDGGFIKLIYSNHLIKQVIEFTV